VPQFVALLFLHCHPIIGINNGRGVLACAKLGIATVGEKGPRPIDKPPSILLSRHAKSILHHLHPSSIRFSSELWVGQNVTVGVSKCPSCDFLFFFFFFSEYSTD
jgi:hypothetical protein